jgi:uncharacterized protein
VELYIIPATSADQEQAYIIYRPLSGLGFLGNQAMADLVKSLAVDPAQPVREEIRAFLDQIGFFEPDPQAPPPPDPNPFSPTNLALLMTNRCQLRCVYCYAAAGEYPPQDLSLEAACAAIDYVYENLKRIHYPQFMISLHGGGEPTFPWKTMKAIVAYAREKPIPVQFSLTSNGVWSRQQLTWIMAYIKIVGISMDGCPQTQDLQRPMASGKGSSAWVMRNLKEMDANGFSYGVRLTAVPPFDRLLDDIRYLCENTACMQMQVEAAFNTRRGEEGRPEVEEGLKFLQAFFAAQRLAEGYGRTLRCAGSDIDKISSTACSSPFNTLVITPHGKTVACFEVVDESHPLAPLATLGWIDSKGVQIDEESRTRLREMIAERRQSCRDCFCYWTCAGDCLIRSFYPDPKDYLVHGPRCEVNRELVRQELLKRIAAGNGVWKRADGRQNQPPGDGEEPC